ncbi:MAG: pyrroline-5-carboxylate reductase [Parasporobacterium sp.]|nr:pyrroline-5-carboxylate reductase [Parasporobacterium sp.]
MKKIGFIGAGNMGGALIMAASATIGGENIIICDHNPGKIEALQESCGCMVTIDSSAVVKESEYIVLGVKPQVMKDTVKSLVPALKERIEAKDSLPVFVTMAAGISTEVIKMCLGTAVPVIRIMPNTPAMVQAGMILYTASADVTDEQMDHFLEMVAGAGSFEKIPEEKMDQTSAVSGCTPAYAYMFIESLADGAVQVGVPRAQALRLAAQAVLGSAKMVLETGIHPDQLKDNVCSPGGSTIEGVNALEKGGFRGLVAEAIVKATEKNIKLGK